jgi:hypothetical protein
MGQTEWTTLLTQGGADRHERSEERLGYRNGYRSRSLTTQVGDIDLLIPKLRAGSFLPSILEPRHRVHQALYAVIMETYIGTPEKDFRTSGVSFDQEPCVHRLCKRGHNNSAKSQRASLRMPSGSLITAQGRRKP